MQAESTNKAWWPGDLIEVMAPDRAEWEFNNNLAPYKVKVRLLLLELSRSCSKHTWHNTTLSCLLGSLTDYTWEVKLEQAYLVSVAWINTEKQFVVS